jgi:hypothetical protein
MLRLVLACALCCGTFTSAIAGPDYFRGRVTTVTFERDRVLIMLDSGRPDNCQGTTYGWMAIQGSYKPLQGLILGLWLRGDLAQTPLTVYTSPVDSSGFCQVTQLAP